MEKRAKIGENVRRENEEILDAVVFGEARVRAATGTRFGALAHLTRRR